ncbi:MAG: hypothetical protein ACYSWU_09080 [Planctomycetota bacterium]
MSWPLRSPCWACCLLIALTPTIVRAEGWLEMIRQDVRSPGPAPSEPSREKDHDHNDDWDCDDHHHHHHDHDHDSVFAELTGWAFLYGLTSPVWLPHGALEDDFGTELLFPRFPYDQAPGYMRDVSWPCGRRWAARLTAEYGGDLDDRDHLGGRLLFSTASRFGLDVQMQRFEERFPGGGHDRLWIGDANLVFRFAQNPCMQWRCGVGLNWLDDPIDTNYGFNFTYGADWYPARPWVLSATLDWGTLGRAELFRFRSTAGVLVNRVETYIGYEYLDIDRTQLNSLLAGVRIWF